MVSEKVRRPAGRPRGQGPRYSERLVIPLTVEQMEQVKALVQRDGSWLAPSTYARQLLLQRAAELLGEAVQS
jgi:hypothetical protein